jgi:tetratricopeptide (TPR) repeat protein
MQHQTRAHRSKAILGSVQILLSSILLICCIGTAGGAADHGFADAISVPEQASSHNPTAVASNNRGVAMLVAMVKKRTKNGALNFPKQRWERVFNSFEKALELDPNLTEARINLGIAHNNYGLSLACQGKKKEAIKEFRRALFIDDANATTASNLASYLRHTGTNPDGFDDRVKLAEEFVANGDVVSAIVEYRCALKLKRDPKIENKLNILLQRLKENKKMLDRHPIGWNPLNMASH